MTIFEQQNKSGWMIEISGPAGFERRLTFPPLKTEAEFIADAVRRVIAQAIAGESVAKGVHSPFHRVHRSLENR